MPLKTQGPATKSEELLHQLVVLNADFPLFTLNRMLVCNGILKTIKKR